MGGGYGIGPFGGDSFGEFDWSKAVLFKLAPEIYRNSDTEGLFLKYTEAQGEVFDTLRRKIADFGLLRDPWQVRTAHDYVEQLRLGKQITSLGSIVAKGLNGHIDSSLAFVADRARFTTEYLGRELTIDGSAIESNNTTVVIAKIYDSFTIGTDPPLSADSGPLVWRVREKVEVPDGEIVVEVLSGSVDSIVPGWVVTDGGGEVEVLARAQFLLSGAEKQVLTEREGSDGVLSGGYFISTIANFTQRDVGKRITISGSENSDNNGKFEISEVADSSTVVLDSDELVNDSGPLTWAVLRRPRLTLTGPTVLNGVLEQEGVTGEATGTGGATGTFTAEFASFTELDVGKLLTARKSGSSNNGVYEIVSVNSSEEITVSPDFVTLGTEADTIWEVRAATGIGDGTYVEAHAPSLLKWLAQDFDSPIDSREDEEWQRRWVASVVRWIGMKGLTGAYEFLAKLTGYDASVTPLYRVDPNYYSLLTLIDAGVYIVGEEGDGRSGTDAFLSLVDGKVRVTSATAAFTSTDEGVEIELSGTDSGTNDGVYAIDSFIDFNTIDLDSLVSLSLPDANDGSIVWRVVRVYSDTSGSRPLFDEVNVDRMEELKTSAFHADMLCTDPDWSSLLGPGSAGDGLIIITAVSPSTGGVLPIVFTVDAIGDFEVVAGLGVWKLTDDDDVEFFLESLPEYVVESTSNTASIVTGYSGRIQAPGVSFTSADIGKRIRITGSSVGNNDIYIIYSIVSSDTVDVDATYAVPAVVPDPSNGSLTAEVLFWRFTVVATQPPVVGDASLEYVCPEISDCTWCRASKLLVEATTPYVLENGANRLSDRLSLATPAHVDIVKAFGVSPKASLLATATGSHATPFTTEWTVAGDAAARTITLPLVSGYNYDCVIDWGDGTTPSLVTAYNDANRIHTYAGDGTYIVKIYEVCEGWSFSNGGDKDKIIDIINWGSSPAFSGFAYLTNGFFGCSNLASLGPSNSIIPISGSGPLSLSRCFRQTGVSGNIPNNLIYNCVNVINLQQLFYLASGLTGRIPAGFLDRAVGIVTLSYAFASCGLLEGYDADLCRNVTSCTDFSFMMYGCNKMQQRSDTFYRPGEEATRFAGQTIDFTSCFRLIGAFTGSQGTAPDLWNATFGGVTSTNCWTGHSTSSVSNWAVIPSAWGGPA
jgi:hypothetical protein